MRIVRLLGICLLLYGCGTNPNGVVLASSIWGTPEQVKVAKAFEAKHAGIKVHIRHIPGNYQAVLMTMIAGRRAPDVMMLEIGSL